MEVQCIEVSLYCTYYLISWVFSFYYLHTLSYLYQFSGETEDVEAGPGMTFDEAQAFLRKWEKKIKADLTSDAAELKIRCTSEKLILFEKKLEFYQSILVPYIGSSERFGICGFWDYFSLLSLNYVSLVAKCKQDCLLKTVS